MTRKTKLWLFFLGGFSMPWFMIWLAGCDIPTERGWQMLCTVLASIYFAFAVHAIAQDFVKEDKS